MTSNQEPSGKLNVLRKDAGLAFILFLFFPQFSSIFCQFYLTLISCGSWLTPGYTRLRYKLTKKTI